MKQIVFAGMAVLEMEQLVREINVMGELRHPTTVKYKCVTIDRQNEILSIVMERCSRPNMLLEEHRQHAALVDESLILKLFVQLVFALRECHYPRTSPSSTET